MARNTFETNLSKLKLIRDAESLTVFFDLGLDKEIIPICYWYFEEWEEDAETVVPAMLKAMELFYTDKKLLLTTLGFDLNTILN